VSTLQSPAAEAVVRGAVELGARLGVCVVADGVLFSVRESPGSLEAGAAGKPDGG
jgi:hypothetical protein